MAQTGFCRYAAPSPAAPKRRRLSAALLAWLFAVSPLPGLADTVTLEIDGVDIPMRHFAATRSDYLLLWLPSEHARGDENEDTLAHALRAAGADVWIADLYSAYFLPPAPSSLNAIEPSTVARLIETLANRTGKTVLLLSNDRGAGLALRAAQAYRAGHAAGRLRGAILISPNLLAATPQAGQDVGYAAVAAANALPLFVIQPRLAVGYLQLPGLLDTLGRHGAGVYWSLLAGVRDRFFFRPDATGREQAVTRDLPTLIARVAPLLQADGAATPPRLAAKTAPPAPPVKPGTPDARGLRPYAGAIETPAFALDDLAGDAHRLDDYRGRVTLVNFWASWCPPCVHEIPSMQRLKTRYSDADFDILAINMGEDRETVSRFMQAMGADFTVLIDTDSATVRQWKVNVFPTSFLVDRTGTLRFGVFGAIDWNDASVHQIVDKLLAQ